MRKFICNVCGYTYDESKGIPEAGIAAGTVWEKLSEDWVCPLCGAPKTEFTPQNNVEIIEKSQPTPTTVQLFEQGEMTPLEISALCSNLAQGCEKQYKMEEAALFRELADYYKASSIATKSPEFKQLIDLVEKDINEGFLTANAVAKEAQDRGALRALVWSEKVTRILKSLLSRYQKEGDEMIKNASLHVCTICGFVYMGDVAPSLCPVCKVQSNKITKV